LTATDGGTGVAGTSYALDGGQAKTYNTPVSLSGEGEHTVEYWSADNAGNVEAHKTAHVKLDANAPTDALSLGESPVHAYLSAGTLYFASSLGGSFTLRDTVSDAGPGAFSATFPMLSAALSSSTARPQRRRAAARARAPAVPSRSARAPTTRRRRARASPGCAPRP